MRCASYFPNYLPKHGHAPIFFRQPYTSWRIANRILAYLFFLLKPGDQSRLRSLMRDFHLLNLKAAFVPFLFVRCWPPRVVCVSCRPAVVAAQSEWFRFCFSPHNHGPNTLKGLFGKTKSYKWWWFGPVVPGQGSCVWNHKQQAMMCSCVKTK